MKILGRAIVILAGIAVAGFGQQWEFGGSAGGTFLNSVAVNGTMGTATAGFQTGAAFGAWVGFNQSSHVGGELRYSYMQSNLSLKSGGTTATFSGMSHVVGYDVILKTNRQEGKVQLFAALGGGMKVFQGTGKESAYQPLNQFGYLTKTRELKPMASVGAGMKYALTRKAFLRVEIHDYITALPKELIAPAPGAKGTLLHDLVPMVGLGFEM
jgi:hypothetical protein